MTRRTSKWRVFATGRPVHDHAPIIPMCPKEQWALDELRRRRLERVEALEDA